MKIEKVPVLPLRDVVVYPNMVVPLFVGRDKSIKSLEDAMNENKKEYYLNMDLPGVQKKDVNVRLENNHVIVSGERKNDTTNNEHAYGKFERIFKVPSNVNINKINANLKNGVLNIAFPKDKNAIGKEIDIKIS